MFDESILKNDEKAIFALRALYQKHGYSRFRMGKFEEYDLYAENKDFLVSDGIITFRDTNGQLLALKPDVTLSIVKSYAAAPVGLRKVYYNESVYRISGNTHTYKELLQSGLECMGELQTQDVSEVLLLALESLAAIHPDYILTLSHVGLVLALLEECGIADKLPILQALSEKNDGALRARCSEQAYRTLCVLNCSDYPVGDALDKLSKAGRSEAYLAAYRDFAQLCKPLLGTAYESHLRIEFSGSDVSGYYSGIVFKGYISGISSHVLSGGEYNGLMRKMGVTARAVGFAVYLDTLERMDTDNPAEEIPTVYVALPKGRLGESVYELFEKAGFECPSIREHSRKLIFENEALRLKFFWVKPSDVAIYVERGAADLGIAGKDILLEYEPNVYELLDLHVGKCRMAVAAMRDFCDDTTKTLRVATKFSHIATRYYSELGRNIELIHLNGSIELAPLLGLSDVIVDIVETGKTLLENNLEPKQTIAPISARLIANKASYRFKAERIEKIKAGLAALTEAEG